MGKKLIGGGGLGKLGGLGLINGMKNSPGSPRTPPIETQFGLANTAMENDFLSYDQLVGMGRIKPGTNLGYSGDQSRFSNLLSGYESSLAAADPTFAAYQNTIRSGLTGLDGASGLPDDYRRTLLEDLRSSQASRGIIDSDTAAIEEAVRLSGGREGIRAQRLSQVQDYLAGVMNPAIGRTSVSIGDMLNLGSSTYGQNLQRAGQNMQYKLGQQQVGADVAGTLIGAAFPTPKKAV